MTTLVLSQKLTLSQRAAAGIVSLFLGVGLVFGAGFASSQGLHDAAHDTRHSIGFPCH